jgi:diguanylate cyclase (GGDEF)-like protein
MQTYNESLEQLATYDTLTGALNARAYYAICDKNIHNAQRSKAPYSVLFIDLDHFKRVNDTYGHSAGDVVLKSVTVCIDSAIRRSDSLGRIGGEEFSVFLPNTGKEGAQHIAEAVRQAIEALNPDIGDLRLPVTASIGYATCDEEIVPMNVIQKRADEAMYLAKSLGRNRVSSLG